jgi:tripartite-type tricarboxylate transporter receptor subunit TctC
MAKALALALLLSFAAHAQDYPAKPVRMVVGFPPGGGTGVVARMRADTARYAKIVKDIGLRMD